MSDTGVIAKYKQQWQEMDPKFKYAMGAIVVGGAILLVVRSNEHEKIQQEQEAAKAVRAVQTAQAAGEALPNNANNFTALPTTNRNQGLEDLLASLEKAKADASNAQEQAKSMQGKLSQISERLAQFEVRNGAPLQARAVPDGASGGGTPYENLPPPVDFARSGKAPAERRNDTNPFNDPALPAETASMKAAATGMHVWDSQAQPAKSVADTPPLTIPINAALESVMLTGINARSNSTGGSGSGTILSANNVGAPFVSRLKGSAILPNGWRVSDFNDCFISGTGIAILSSERANVISNVMSCVDKKGNVYEAKIRAYGVDLDGIQGISGKVVTKQGSLLAKTALAGVASGLGSAFTPTPIQGYNQNMQSGDRQGFSLPNPALIGGSALGGGVNEAGKALAKFYLDYAKEMFPVIEVNAGTRITWILQETVELNHIRKANR
jgi:conjugal transfer pilus assembly protein TraB